MCTVYSARGAPRGVRQIGLVQISTPFQMDYNIRSREYTLCYSPTDYFSALFQYVSEKLIVKSSLTDHG